METGIAVGYARLVVYIHIALTSLLNYSLFMSVHKFAYRGIWVHRGPASCSRNTLNNLVGLSLSMACNFSSPLPISPKRANTIRLRCCEFIGHILK